MKWILFEMENSEESVTCGLPNNFLGISEEFLESIPGEKGNFPGYTRFKSKYVPVVVPPVVEKPKVKFFLVYNEFAVGVTRVLDFEESDQFETVEGSALVQGVLELPDTKVYLLRFEKLNEKAGRTTRFEYVPVRSEESRKPATKSTHEYLILDEKFALEMCRVAAIIEKDAGCMFSRGELWGYLEYEDDIIEVLKIVEEGKWIVVSHDRGYLCSRIGFCHGERLEDATGRSLVKTGTLTLELLE